MRHVILHHHIFKNAGSSLDAALAGHFGDAFSGIENGGDLVSAAQLQMTLREAPKLQALSSHHFSGQNFENVLSELGVRAFHVALVRRPWERIISAYNYLSSSDQSDEAALIAKSEEPLYFIKWMLNNQPHQINSPQVNIFANHGFYAKAVSEVDLERAWSRYRSFALCAPTDRFDEAMVTLEYFCSPAYRPQGLKLHYIRSNVSSPKAALDAIRQSLPKMETDLINEMNRYDEELYHRSSVELDRRISLIPDFPERLAEFKERCARLRASQEPTDIDHNATVAA